ncbi:MAG TPA: CotH kinase family protein [Flavobacterium sp.]|nr:CotH kinase family protein [Flavobacterium sp.]
MRIFPQKLRILKLAAIFIFLLNYGMASGQAFTDTNLPIVIINTDINPNTSQPYEIVDNPRVLAAMKIIRHPDGTRNYMTDQNTAAFLNYNGRINIEIRGSSSQDLPKKQYGLTTLQADNTSNNNVALLGMPSENDWVLNGLAFDPSLIRDYLSYNLARQIGDYAPRTEYCEVVVNGEYVGLYILQEKIKADSNRVNIVKIATTDTTVPNLTGGYITKADKLTGGDPVAWSMPSYVGSTEFIHDLPKPEDVTTAQDTYIHSQFTALASASHLNITSLTNGYPSIIDVPTFVDFMIINELASNADAYQLSTYFHKDRGGKLRAGPIWDHNLTYGNDLFQYGLDRSHYDVWQFGNGDNEGAKFWKDLFNNSTYKCYLSKRWNQLIQNGQPLNHASIVTFINNTIDYIAEAIARENAKWGTIPDHDTEIQNLKTFLLQRINWISLHVGGYTACVNVAVPALVINKINYNPGTDTAFPVSNDQEFIGIVNNGFTIVNLSGVYFSELGISYQFPASATINVGQTLYLASNPATFQAKYGIAAFGQFTRNLSNSSQKLILADGFGNVIDYVQYSDSAPWPNADGNGSYLQLISNSLDNSLASSWIATSSALSADSFSIAADLSVYPNPVANSLSVNSTATIQDVKIFDVYGKLLQSVKGNSNTMDIDFRTYPKGMYLLKIEYEGGFKTEKIIRQ